MGLGKTVQVLAFLAAVLGKTCTAADRCVIATAHIDAHVQALHSSFDPGAGCVAAEPTHCCCAGSYTVGGRAEERQSGETTGGGEDRKKKKKILIVGPVSVVHQWARELGIWAHFHAVPVKRLADLEAAVRKLNNGTAEICVVGYERFRMSAEVFARVDWHLVIFDEAVSRNALLSLPLCDSAIKALDWRTCSTS